MLQQGRYVQTSLVVNRAAVVLHRHNSRARFGKQLARYAAHIAKALHCNARAFYFQAYVVRCFTTHREHAAPGGFTPAQ